MIRDYGSPERWQKHQTQYLINKAVTLPNETVFIEGSTDPSFVEESCLKAKLKSYNIILISCSQRQMEKRLRENRNQPELINQDMKNWHQYLLDQARRNNYPVLDNTGLTVEQSLILLLESVNVSSLEPQ